MGNNAFKCKKEVDSDVIPSVVNITQRENMATWHRTDIPLTDVYEVMETIGQSQMGEVLKVRRKVENRGLHNAETREKKIVKDIDSSDHRSLNSFSSKSSNPFMSRKLKKQQKKKHEEILKKNEVDVQNTKVKPPLSPQTATKLKPILKKTLKYTAPGDTEGYFPAISQPDRYNQEEENLQRQANANMHPHFSHAEYQSLNQSIASENDFSITEGGVETEISTDSYTALAEKSGEKKDRRWVPRRKIRFQRLYACKTIATETIKTDQMRELLNEIYMMRKMDHPYIIRLYEVYQVNRKIWLVMDLCTGGNLTTRKLKESEVTVVSEQILRGVTYLHKRGICHRNLKLENILYENGSTNSSIRLIDFGLSKTYDFNPNGKGGKSAAYCTSPEIAGDTGPYTEKSDVWSIGIIVWILLAGDYPFLKSDEDMKNEEKKEKLINGSIEFGITWRGRGITNLAKTFVKGCLKKDPMERWSAMEALEFLQDQWISALEAKSTGKDEVEDQQSNAPSKPTALVKDTNGTTAMLQISQSSNLRKESNIFDHDIMEDIVRFTKFGLLKKTALVALANRLDRKDVGMLSELFLLVDTNQTGTISPDELKGALNELKMPNMNEELMESIFAGIDHDRSGQIHWSEFLAALAEGAGLITEERVSDAFDRIDCEGKGYISHQDLKNILGQNYEEETTNKMIEEGDFKKNGRVEYDEFVQLMLPDR